MAFFSEWGQCPVICQIICSKLSDCEQPDRYLLDILPGVFQEENIATRRASCPSREWLQPTADPSWDEHGEVLTSLPLGFPIEN